ncbi:M57 family metalloprotease [Pyxidicoccus sp. 3LFB2]
MSRRARRSALPPSWRGLLLGTLLGAGCAPEPVASGEAEPLGQTRESFEQFMQAVTRDRETGAYVVEGDLPFSSVEQVREYWEHRPSRSGGLIVHQAGGVDAAWSGTDRTRLTYCISQAGFGGAYGTVVQAMEDAASDWENSAAVDFQHIPSQDGSCTASNPQVVFSVEYTSGQPYIASAFFPNAPRSSRRLMIDLYQATNAAPLTLTGILRHELGHALGFRHEHTRPESGCYEDSSWRALTPYDRASVMHYPPNFASCGGTNTGDFVLTAWDRIGAATLYGAANRKNFNGDRHTDILWWHPGSGRLSAWMMDGTQVLRDSYVSKTTSDSSGWSVKGTGDFNCDGHTDVIWYHPASGQVALWYLNGTTVVGEVVLSRVSHGSEGWDLKGTGDFNRDGHTDVVWHHSGHGQVAIWYLNGTTVVGNAVLSQTSPGSAGWEIKGTGDFNRDGHLDVLWYNGWSGQVGPWYLDGTTVTGYAYFSWNVPGSAGWTVVSR